MGKPLRTLIVEDNEDDVVLLIDELKRGGYEPTYECVDTSAALGAALAREPWDIIMSDYSMPHFSAPAALAVLKDHGLDIPFIIVSSALGDEVTAAAMNAGAHDYIRYENLARLVPAIERERHAAKARAARLLAEASLREADAKYRTLAQQIPAGVHIMALAEGSSPLTVSINPQFERMLGFSETEWMADPDLWRKQLHPDDAERVLAEAARLYVPDAEPFISEYRMLTRDSQTVWLRDETVVVRDATGRAQYLQSIRLDITARKRAEAELQEANEKLARWVNELERHNREITLLNELGTHLHTCLTTEEAYTAVADYPQMLFPAESGALYVLSPSRTSVEAVAVWGEFLTGEQVFAPDECWALRRGKMHLVEDPRTGQVCPHLGDTLSTSYLCVPMTAQGEAIGILHLQRRPSGTGPLDAPRESLTESKQHLAQAVAELIALALANLKLRETLRIESSRDPLTGLFNRRYLEETLERELRRATRKQRPLGVILLDLDDFNGFNDAHGHDAGDALLHEAGGFLQKHIRGEDVVGRYSGEEFVLLMPEASLEVTRQRADKIREEFQQLTVEHRGELLKGGALSAGVVVSPEHVATVEAIMQAAAEDLARVRAEARERIASAPAPVSAAAGSGEGQTADADQPSARPNEAPPPLVVGALALNPQTFELTIGDKIIRPTPVEYELLYFLMSHAGKIFTAEQLSQEVWHYPPGTGSHESVRAHIKNIRSKIEPDPKHPVHLKTIGRFGYTIPEDEASLPAERGEAAPTVEPD
jgi:diguanylate cyclase (GGDEF)-like protein/PAS domain S-box-containing protein